MRASDTDWDWYTMASTPGATFDDSYKWYEPMTVPCTRVGFLCQRVNVEASAHVWRSAVGDWSAATVPPAAA
jgi:hypothetical protein